MIKAKEANTMVREAEERIIAETRQKAIEFCESLSDAIREKAENRQSNLTFNRPNDIPKDYIISTLQANGYRVSYYTSDMIEIWW